MEKGIIGTILRNRIKEMNYTQEDFAEKAGISLSSLKKYMNGTTAYSYELMETFAELLDCSYDYLLGLSKSAKREFRDIREQIEFTDETLQKLTRYSKVFNTDYEAKRYLTTLDIIIRSKGLVTCIADYLICSRYIEKMVSLTNRLTEVALTESGKFGEATMENNYILSVENQILISLISELKNAKQVVSPELLEEIKKAEPVEKLEEELNMALQKLAGR